MVGVHHVTRHCCPPQVVRAGQLAQLSTDMHHWSSWYVCPALHPPPPHSKLLVLVNSQTDWSWYVCKMLYITVTPKLLVLVNSHSCQQSHITGHGVCVLRYPPPPHSKLGLVNSQLSTHTSLVMVCVYCVTRPPTSLANKYPCISVSFHKRLYTPIPLHCPYKT